MNMHKQLKLIPPNNQIAPYLFFFLIFSLVVIIFDFHSSRTFAFTLASLYVIPISMSSFVIVNLHDIAGRPTLRRPNMSDPLQSFVLNAFT
ncbi:hypothetical protein BpHYR1_031655 [Brachionus plicatilis]|uniref:Uncharacterized protein n=1 Tax=Brachionus plicatilis TaxID=10195 RepID=A0A3M7SGJ7_BRAPC|nr:hypothetical protein BpHYR1_031655 [Brachionus plicatilis]